MPGIHIELKCGDALAESADVLVLKHAQGRFGVDEAVDAILEAEGRRLHLPRPSDYRIEESTSSIAASQILMLGVPPLPDFSYKDIRTFARQALAVLAEKLPDTRTIVFTLHGSGYGLDEVESFESEIAGLADAIRIGDYPHALTKISIVELQPGRVKRLNRTLATLLPNSIISDPIPGFLAAIASTLTEVAPEAEVAKEKLLTAGIEADAKPRVFVAMPFKEEMDDIYHYGIVSATNAAGYLCERADISSFTGDVIEWVKARIRSASLVIADLTEANPNVYLEVGYAWGCGIPTVLLIRNGDPLKFDVRSQRCLVYKKIKHLEDLLTAELKALSNSK
jgi:hypothetical protein